MSKKTQKYPKKDHIEAGGATIVTCIPKHPAIAG
jgi:hypothetical protein